MNRRRRSTSICSRTTVEEWIEVVVDERPARVGIDPYDTLIDRDPDDDTAPL